MLPDSFSIDLILRHPWRSTRSTAKALSVKPQTIGSKRGTRRTYFKAVLQSGRSPAKFQLALRQVVRFLRKNEKFWEKFLAEKGSGEIVFNHNFHKRKTEISVLSYPLRRSFANTYPRAEWA